MIPDSQCTDFTTSVSSNSQSLVSCVFLNSVSTSDQKSPPNSDGPIVSSCTRTFVGPFKLRHEVGLIMSSRTHPDNSPAADLSSELLKPLALLWLQQLEPTLNIDPESIVEDAVRRNQIATDVPGYVPGPGSIFVFERSSIPRWSDAGFFPYSHHTKVGKYESVMYHGCTSDRLRLDPLLRINIHNIRCGVRDYELVLFLSNPNFVNDHVPFALVRLMETLAQEFEATPQDVLASIRQHVETMSRDRTNPQR